MKNGSIDDHLKFLGAGIREQPRSRRRVRARRSRDIYWELIARIKNRTITPIRPAYQHSGELDPINTVIRTADLANIAEERGEQPKYLTKYLRLKTSPVAQRQRRGPAPGTVNRYGDADRKLFPKIKRLMRERRITASAAAAELAELNNVAGVGSKSSRAKRLAKRFLSETR